jgi:hypothetical protein
VIILAIGLLALLAVVSPRHAGSLLLLPILRTSGDTRIIAHMFQRSKRFSREKQGISKGAFSQACRPLSMVACGDREDFLQLLQKRIMQRQGLCMKMN